MDRSGKVAVAARSALKDAHPLAVKGDKVIIGFEVDFAEEKEKFNLARNAMAVNHALSGMLKREVVAEFVAAENMMAGVPAVDECPEKKEGKTTDAPPAAKTGKKKTRHDIVNDDAVIKIMETFNGSIAEIRE